MPFIWRFSLCTSSLASACDIQTPADIRRRLLHSLSPVFEKRGWKFGVELVSTATWSVFGCRSLYIRVVVNVNQTGTKIRDWAVIAPNTVTFKNAFKIRKAEDGLDTVPVPHSFTFLARQDMPSQGFGISKVERIPVALRSPADSPRDIMVKQRMASTSLCQDPLLCMPGSLQGQADAFLRQANSSDCPKLTWKVEGERRSELDLLGRAICRDFPHMSRAIAFYQGHLSDSVIGDVPTLTFLKHAAPLVADDLHNFNLPARAVEPKPHSLQVVFHRG